MTWINTSTISNESEQKQKSIFALDFDGTLVENAYPSIGAPLPGAIETMQELTARGYRIILLTMRSGKELDEAVVYCNKNNIDLWGVNQNPDQHKWTTSPKVYANVYIDDCGAGIPLRSGSNTKPCVDWLKLRNLFVEWGILEPIQTEEGVRVFEIK